MFVYQRTHAQDLLPLSDCGRWHLVRSHHDYMTPKGLLTMTLCELYIVDAGVEQLQYRNLGDAVVGSSEFERKRSLIENLLCSRYSTHMLSTAASKVVLTVSPSTVEENEAKGGSVTSSRSHR